MKKYFLLILGVFVFFSSCKKKKEEEIAPKEEPKGLIYYDSNKLHTTLVNQIDSNKNSIYSTVDLNIATSFSRSGKVKFRVFANSKGVNVRYAETNYITVTANEVYETQIKVTNDSILSKNLDASNVAFTVQFIAENGSIVTNANNNSSGINPYLTSISLESEEKDKLPYIRTNLSFQNGSDLNKNYYYQFPKAIKLSIAYPGPAIRCYAKLYMGQNYNEPNIYYASTNSFTIITSENHLSHLYDLTFKDITKDSLSKGNYTLRIDILDSATHKVLSTTGNIVNYSMESEFTDKQVFELTSVSITPLEDSNNNSYPSAYKLKVYVKADFPVSTNPIMNIVIGDLFNIYLNNKIQTTINVNDTTEIILPASSILTKNIYNIKLELRTRAEQYIDYITLAEWGHLKFKQLEAVKFETFEQDAK